MAGFPRRLTFHKSSTVMGRFLVWASRPRGKTRVRKKHHTREKEKRAIGHLCECDSVVPKWIVWRRTRTASNKKAPGPKIRPWGNRLTHLRHTVASSRRGIFRIARLVR